MSGARLSAIKFALLGRLRAAGLLQLADFGKFLLSQARAQSTNRRFLAQHPNFPVPPRHLAFDALNHVNWRRYHETGLQHAALFAGLIRDHAPPAGPLRVLEWGCGPGRLIRHMTGLLSGIEVSITGADYNGESIGWCRNNLPGIAFVVNGLNPPLPLEAASFDVVYNFSVFTHLSGAVQLDWAGELLRVLKPGGLLICTTHGDGYRHLLASREEQRAYAAGELVEQGNYREGRKWYFAIHPETFVRERLLSGWDEVRRITPRPEDSMLQDIWIARRPGPPVRTP